MSPARSECLSYADATKLLAPARLRWSNAHAELKAAREAYLDQAEREKIRLCGECNKPMPDYDSSCNCDECHLPWGSATSEGRAKQRAAEIDAQIDSLRAERAKL